MFEKRHMARQSLAATLFILFTALVPFLLADGVEAAEVKIVYRQVERKHNFWKDGIFGPRDKGYVVKDTPVTNLKQFEDMLPQKPSRGELGLLETYKQVTGDGVDEEQKNFSRYVRERAEITGDDITIYLVDDTQYFTDHPNAGLGDTPWWPHQSGNHVKLSQTYFNSNFSTRDPKRGVEIVRGLFAHEFNHAQDGARMKLGSYGPQSGHSLNEILGNETIAWMEGSSQYHRYQWDATRREMDLKTVFPLKREHSKDTEEWVTFDEATAEDLLKNETINAYVLLRISENIENGEDKIEKTFIACNNDGNRTLKSYIKKLIEMYPDDRDTVLRILDETTGMKLTDKELKRYFGDDGKRYVSTVRVELREGYTPDEVVRWPEKEKRELGYRINNHKYQLKKAKSELEEAEKKHREALAKMPGFGWEDLFLPLAIGRRIKPGLDSLTSGWKLLDLKSKVAFYEQSLAKMDGQLAKLDSLLSHKARILKSKVGQVIKGNILDVLGKTSRMKDSLLDRLKGGREEASSATEVDSEEGRIFQKSAP